ncbi:hypothetical protein ACFL7D_02335 [candidate division KSB1 bacterium]
MNRSRFIISTIMAWLIFIGIDFIIHASVLAELWLKEVPAIKDLTELAYLIPFGYLSFLILTLLFGWIFLKIHPEDPGMNNAVIFGIKFGGLFSAANFSGLYSFVDIPLLHLFAFNFVYFVELTAVSAVYGWMLYSETIKKKVVRLMILFFILLITGLVIQNIFGNYNAV